MTIKHFNKCGGAEQDVYYKGSIYFFSLVFSIVEEMIVNKGRAECLMGGKILFMLEQLHSDELKS